MNERFENLAEEAMVHVPGQTGLHTRAFSLEKFAELIVEEMYDFIMEEVSNDNGIPDLGKVKEHFGVTE